MKYLCRVLVLPLLSTALMAGGAADTEEKKEEEVIPEVYSGAALLKHPTKLKPSVRIHKRTPKVKKGATVDEKAIPGYQVTVKVTVENYFPSAVEQFGVNTYVIGRCKNGRKRAYCILGKRKDEMLEIKKRGRLHLDPFRVKASKSRTAGISYAGHIVVVKAAGKVMSITANPTFVKNIAEKILAYAPVEYDNKMPKAGDFFDMKGESVEYIVEEEEAK